MKYVVLKNRKLSPKLSTNGWDTLYICILCSRPTCFFHIFPPLSANQTCDAESVLHIVSGRIQDLACNRSFVSIEVECPGKGCFEDNNFNDSLLVCRLNKTQYNSLKIRTESVSKSDLIWFYFFFFFEELLSQRS